MTTDQVLDMHSPQSGRQELFAGLAGIESVTPRIALCSITDHTIALFEQRALDENVLRQLDPYFARPARDQYLLDLVQRIGKLIEGLVAGDMASQEFNDFKHEMLGPCGMLGCTLLANALKQDIPQSGESAISLMEVAERTLHALQDLIGRP